VRSVTRDMPSLDAVLARGFCVAGFGGTLFRGFVYFIGRGNSGWGDRFFFPRWRHHNLSEPLDEEGEGEGGKQVDGIVFAGAQSGNGGEENKGPGHRAPCGVFGIEGDEERPCEMHGGKGVPRQIRHGIEGDQLVRDGAGKGVDGANAWDKIVEKGASKNGSKDGGAQ